MLERWKTDRVITGLTELAEDLKEYLLTAVSLIPGGAGAVALYRLEEGEYTSAALEVVFMGPVLKLAGSGSASVAIKVGGEIVANIPVKVIQSIKRLKPSDQVEVLNILRRHRNSPDDALEEVTKFLERRKIYFHGSSALDPAMVDEVADEGIDIFESIAGKTEPEIRLAGKSTKWTGEKGEAIFKKLLQEAGYTEVFAIQNGSNHGLDVIAKLGDGQYAVFEVKATSVSRAGWLSTRQAKGINSYLNAVLSLAARGRGAYKNVDQATKQRAKELWNEIQVNGVQNISGNLVQIDLIEKKIHIRPWKD